MIQLPGFEFSLDHIAQHHTDIAQHHKASKASRHGYAFPEPAKEQARQYIQCRTHADTDPFAPTEPVGFVKIVEKIGLHITDEIIDRQYFAQREDFHFPPMSQQFYRTVEKRHTEKVGTRLEVDLYFMQQIGFQPSDNLLFHGSILPL
jgi:hypothetical protein